MDIPLLHSLFEQCRKHWSGLWFTYPGTIARQPV
ncbi:hypothetical protein MicloDRAFT_00005080 [Microvirga lotononidis]|uniref:Uncharacterized protein n=1 Tax=Microvirga lotononidis TaxID=864069 RepID=I4Z435_9HYPH|nr:hypothetical protein MicloDRAFT_00005080 [Microvirga lotononidis]